MSITRLAALAGVALVGAGGALAAQAPTSDGVIQGCYAKRGGDLRIVSATRFCRRTELPLRWNAQGRLESPDGRFSLEVTNTGITLEGPSARVEIGLAGVEVEAGLVRLNGGCAPIARMGDAVAGGRVVGASGSVFSC